MRDFFERYSYDSVHMLLNQVAISLFGFAMAMTAAKTGNDTFLMAVSVCSIIFYLALQLGTARKVGIRDKTSMDLGKRPFRPFTGTLISLLANSLNIILAVIITIMALTSRDGGSGIPRVFALLIQGMYQGILAVIQVGGNAEAPIYMNDCWWAYFLIILPALLISTVGYLSGVLDWHIFSFSPSDLPASDRPTRKEIKERKQQEKQKKHK